MRWPARDSSAKRTAEKNAGVITLHVAERSTVRPRIVRARSRMVPLRLPTMNHQTYSPPVRGRPTTFIGAAEKTPHRIRLDHQSACAREANTSKHANVRQPAFQRAVFNVLVTLRSQLGCIIMTKSRAVEYRSGFWDRLRNYAAAPFAPTPACALRVKPLRLLPGDARLQS